MNFEICKLFNKHMKQRLVYLSEQQDKNHSLHNILLFVLSFVVKTRTTPPRWNVPLPLNIDS